MWFAKSEATGKVLLNAEVMVLVSVMGVIRQLLHPGVIHPGQVAYLQERL